MSYGSGGNFDPGSVPGGQRPYPQSYNDPNFPHRQPPGSGNRTLFWILGIVAAIVILGAIACCGIGYFGVRFVSTEVAKQLRPQLQSSPEIAEHIGEIQEMTLNVQAMQQEDRAGKMVFDITGTKGSGQVIVDPGQFTPEARDEGVELVLSDGRRIPLTGLGPALQEVDPEQVDPEAPDEPRPVDAPPEAEPAAPADAEPEQPIDSESPTESESPAEIGPTA